MITVVKASGEKEPFSEKKVLDSIGRAGINPQIKNMVLSHVKSKLYDNIPTSQIYHHIVEFLDKSETPYAKARYGLKEAIMNLGPTGYPFEDYIADLLASEGYLTRTRNILSGKCITHEIDVIAEKENKKVMIEAKFHNRSGTRTDVGDALYTKARFDDVKDKNNFDQVWLVTNTKVTQDAIDYAICVGMKILSWDYPNESSLRDLIEKSRLHPITVLNTLSHAQKQQLFENHVVLCKDICDNPKSLDILHLPEEKKQNILAEAGFVCKI